MANNNDYKNIEQRKREHTELKKSFKWLAYFIYAIATFVILAFLLTNQNYTGEIKISQYLILSTHDQAQTPLNLALYYVVGGVLIFFFWSLFAAKSVAQIEDDIKRLSSLKRKVGQGLLLKLKLYRQIDKALYYLYYPLSMAMIPTDHKNEINRQRYYLRLGWMSHLRYKFFKQKVRVVDGYERVERLTLLKDLPLLFSNEKDVQKARVSNEYRTLFSMFRSHDQFLDLFKIAEGYLSQDGAEKYDSVMSTEEFEDVLQNQYGGSIDNFRVFDGKANITFSFDLIKKLIDEETGRFSLYLDKFAITSTGLEYTRSIQKYYEMLKGDPEMDKLLRGVYLPEPLPKDKKITDAERIERSKYIMVLYFRFFALFYILNQFINLPAGTAVVKMKDYSLRMITEIYDNKCIVSIVKGKNDGSNPAFRSDAFANMFLLSWNYYNYTVSDSFVERVERIFNLRDEEVEEIASGRNSTDSMTAEVEQALREEKPEGIEEAFAAKEKATEKFIENLSKIAS